MSAMTTMYSSHSPDIMIWWHHQLQAELNTSLDAVRKTNRNKVQSPANKRFYGLFTVNVPESIYTIMCFTYWWAWPRPAKHVPNRCFWSISPSPVWACWGQTLNAKFLCWCMFKYDSQRITFRFSPVSVCEHVLHVSNTLWQVHTWAAIQMNLSDLFFSPSVWHCHLTVWFWFWLLDLCLYGAVLWLPLVTDLFRGKD